MPTRRSLDEALDAPVTSVRYVTEKRAEALARLGISTVRDLVCHYPRRYLDFTQTATVADAAIGEEVTIVGTIADVSVKKPRPRFDIVEAGVYDKTGVILGVWFRQPWMARRLSSGQVVAMSGKVSFDYGFKRMNSPFIEVIGETEEEADLSRIIPVHGTTEGISTAWMRRLVATALDGLADLPDPLPAGLRFRDAFMSRKEAFRQIHFPKSAELRDEARRRLAYEELFFLQLELMRLRAAEETGAGAIVHDAADEVLERYRSLLPFELTEEQDAALARIVEDMRADAIMNRMLLGDVGTGKTVVAGASLVVAAKSGHQAAMMAPTEVLARQYGQSLGTYLDKLGITWATLTAATPASEREEILSGLADGSLSVVFGTHALIENDVVFKSLSLVVIDEQHRFGVEQRAALRAKGPGSDLLVMTATPIPRTLALTLYGDLECSFLRTRPASRPPTTTRIVSRDRRDVAYDAIRAALEQGRQAYIICPLVGVSRKERTDEASREIESRIAAGEELTTMKAAQDEAAFLGEKVFVGNEVGLLTGRMKAPEKQEVMQRFYDGEIDVLVATTVVEVGIDVPNATVMMIEDAERFGLSQLHQLRGRVSRGRYPGQVFLVADPSEDDTETAERLQAMVECDDGFELAERDLRARREGDVLGSRQHGASTLKLVQVLDDAELVQRAHDDARAILADDPDLGSPEHRVLAHELDMVFSERQMIE